MKYTTEQSVSTHRVSWGWGLRTHLQQLLSAAHAGVQHSHVVKILVGVRAERVAVGVRSQQMQKDHHPRLRNQTGVKGSVKCKPRGLMLGTGLVY